MPPWISPPSYATFIDFQKLSSDKPVIVDPYFSRAPPLDRQDSLLLMKQVVFEKVGVATYFILF